MEIARGSSSRGHANFWPKGGRLRSQEEETEEESEQQREGRRKWEAAWMSWKGSLRKEWAAALGQLSVGALGTWLRQKVVTFPGLLGQAARLIQRLSLVSQPPKREGESQRKARDLLPLPLRFLSVEEIEKGTLCDFTLSWTLAPLSK